jgi:hypothetical protein
MAIEDLVFLGSFSLLFIWQLISLLFFFIFYFLFLFFIFVQRDLKYPSWGSTGMGVQIHYLKLSRAVFGALNSRVVFWSVPRRDAQESRLWIMTV